MPDSLISPDGKFYWDGQRWVPMQQPAQQPVIQPAQQAVVPSAGSLPVQQAQQPVQAAEGRFSDDRQWWWNGSQWVPASQAPAPRPPAIMAPAAVALGGAGFTYQFGGPAAWSIGIGVVSTIVPLFAGYYFYFLPVVGFINAIRAIQRGRMVGGVVGIIANIIGGIMSLIASGLLFR